TRVQQAGSVMMMVGVLVVAGGS
ncbi:MAG: hypothetical protein QOI71_2207, partial [Gaiellales bacterium]|nr:hypothetical protein [Gaiellales bacterium]